MPDTTDAAAETKLKDLVGEHAMCMMTTVDAEGRIVARPMALQDFDDDNALWFFTDDGEPKVVQLREDPRVGLTFSDKGWVSIHGTATIVKDAARQRELWNPAVAAWMQCEPDDPRVALIKVDAAGGQYWHSPGGAPAALLGIIAAKITGKQPDMGGTAKVDLD